MTAPNHLVNVVYGSAQSPQQELSVFIPSRYDSLREKVKHTSLSLCKFNVLTQNERHAPILFLLFARPHSSLVASLHSLMLTEMAPVHLCVIWDGSDWAALTAPLSHRLSLWRWRWPDCRLSAAEIWSTSKKFPRWFPTGWVHGFFIKHIFLHHDRDFRLVE